MVVRGVVEQRHAYVALDTVRSNKTRCHSSVRIAPGGVSANKTCWSAVRLLRRSPRVLDGMENCKEKGVILKCCARERVGGHGISTKSYQLNKYEVSN